MPLYKLYSTSPNRPTTTNRGAARVRVASAANINLASPGATVDGVTMAAGEEFLAGNQSTPAQDGIYVFNGAAVAASRSDLMPAGAAVRGAEVVVEEGTFADKLFICTNNQGADVVGTDNLVFKELLPPSRAYLPFGQENVAAGDNATPASSIPVQTGWCGAAIAKGWTAPRAGYISGLSLSLSDTPAGSDLIAGVYLNGTLVVGSEVALSAGGGAVNSSTFADGSLVFAEGDVLDVRIRTGTEWSATTADLGASIEVTI